MDIGLNKGLGRFLNFQMPLLWKKVFRLYFGLHFMLIIGHGRNLDPLRKPQTLPESIFLDDFMAINPRYRVYLGYFGQTPGTPGWRIFLFLDDFVHPRVFSPQARPWDNQKTLG
jgi:hypothetical protein